MRSALAVCLLASLSACSHRMYQRTPDAADRSALADATELLIDGSGKPDVTPALERIDLNGRLALLDLFRHSMLNRGSLEAPSQELLSLVALVLRGTEQSGRPFTEPELRGALAGTLDSLDEGRWSETLSILLGEPVVPPEKERRAAVGLQLQSLALQGCKREDPTITYDAEILRHVDGPDSRAWTRWREGLERLHLVTLHCEGKHGAVLLSRHEGRPPELVAWQFFSPEQWEGLAARLEGVMGKGS